MSGANEWTAISIYGTKKLAFVKHFLPFADGTPSHDQLGNIFAALDAEAFQACFIDWVALKFVPFPGHWGTLPLIHERGTEWENIEEHIRMILKRGQLIGFMKMGNPRQCL
ncbi:MAG: hypothetical protein ACI8TF_001320 [Paracoccaceae bacterium]